MPHLGKAQDIGQLVGPLRGAAASGRRVRCWLAPGQDAARGALGGQIANL